MAGIWKFTWTAKCLISRKRLFTFLRREGDHRIGHTTCAWSPEYSDLRSYEFIEVSFPLAMVAKQIAVIENSNSGHIQSIYTYDEKHKEQLVYKKSGEVTIGGGRLFVLALKDNNALIKGVKLLMDKPETLKDRKSVV